MRTNKLTHEEHKKVHVVLHRKLDELLADFIDQTGSLLSKTTLLEFLKWSHEQTINPTEKELKT